MMTARIEAVNEFVLRFANVNGTGSASANSLVAKSFFRLGVPIGPKNMFPSNIQGSPTWFEVRASAKGYTGRRGGVDISVAMNRQSLMKDMAAVNSGGYFLYDSTRHLSPKMMRDDIQYFPIPITELIRNEFQDARARSLLKNIVYVGTLAALLDIDIEHYRDLLREDFSAKKDLLEQNYLALDIGYKYAKEHFNCPFGIRVEKMQGTDGKIIFNGNDALGLGAVFGGATVCGWYPITPSTSVVDAFSRHCSTFRKNKDDQNNYAIIQAEDEISAIGMILGAGWAGARSFTATSGPGISLMSEFIGYAYYSETPIVLFNIQRCGPSTGMPTRTQQADLLLCAYASHGDTKHILLFPSTPNECFEMGAKSFDIAERFQTPVFVMSDLELGMNEFMIDELSWDDSYQHDRGKVLTKAELDSLEGPYHRYMDKDDDGIAARTLPDVQAKGAFLTRGSGHDKFGRYTEDSTLYQENMERLVKKFTKAAAELPPPEIKIHDVAAEVGLIYFGTTYEPMFEASQSLRDGGASFNEMRVKAFPFSGEVQHYIDRHQKIIVIEQNRDKQFRTMLMSELTGCGDKIESVLGYDGMPLTANFLIDHLRDAMGGSK